MKDTTKKTTVTECVILLVILLAAGYMFVSSASFAAETKLFPQIVSGVVFLCCLVKLALDLRTLHPAKAAGQPQQEKETAARKPLFTKEQLFVLATAVLYVALLQPVGFLPCTVAVLIALPWLLGYRRWLVLIPFSLAITAAFYLIFRYGFYIKLPAGILSGLL